MTLRTCLRRCVFASLLLAGPLRAQDLPPQMGQYMPLYPGMYFNGGYLQDPRDSVFDAGGNRRSTVTPSDGGQTSFPLRLGVASFTWHFPMFETAQLPLLSTQTHIARVTVRYGQTRTRGALSSYIESQSANGLQNNGDGVGDTTFEFGSFVFGGHNWRDRPSNPIAGLLLFGVNAPTGGYDRDAPNNIGSNTWSFHGRAGLHWEPPAWPGAYFDVGGAYQRYARTEEAAFGGLAPFKQGADRYFDLSFTQHVWQGLYAGVYGNDRRGNVNQYQDPQFAPNAPTPPPGSSNSPNPGSYYDTGTSQKIYGATVEYFVTQRWLVALNYSRPRDGKSGEFDLPYTNFTPANCLPGAASCTPSPGGTAHEDGFGPARSYASASWMLTVSHNFDLGDYVTCTGCRQ